MASEMVENPAQLAVGQGSSEKQSRANGTMEASHSDPTDESPAKKRKIEGPQASSTDQHDRPSGIAPIKPEYLLEKPAIEQAKHEAEPARAREASDTHIDGRNEGRGDGRSDGRNKDKKGKKGGQNTKRDFGSSRDAIQLCKSRSTSAEFSPAACPYGDKCKFEHDIRRYLKDGKRADLHTFQSRCPVWDAKGYCHAGWRCRFAGSHSKEIEREDGRRELVLVVDEGRNPTDADIDDDFQGADVFNVLPANERIALRKHQIPTAKAEQYNEWLVNLTKDMESFNHAKKRDEDDDKDKDDGKDVQLDARAQYREPPFRASEKRRIYYGTETPVLAPLTTQGNLPYRRLCVELGAQVTWSEMAVSLPLIQGEKSEWALMKAHKSEMAPPRLTSATTNAPKDYDNTKDLRFGVQIAANKPWSALKATELLTKYAPNLRAIDLNCGCPIDMIYRQGSGSALLDQPAKLEKILRGMNALSGEIPITAKIRTGTKDGKPTSHRLVERLAFGGTEASEASLGPPGVAAITLHGRSRQQRYTRSADWSYIAECASIIRNYNEKRDDMTDTIYETDQRDLPAQDQGRMYFLGNGDCYSHVDYYKSIEESRVDSVMIARGALIKPWLFEEIEKNQYLDKSATERLAYIEKFARYGLETWGSDEIGVGTTRKFLLEWLSFACRYVPLGILEHLPPRLQDRPPPYKGRNDLETLLSSPNYKDWIKISEMFLGPAAPGFKFEPKHKSNAYEETEAEG